MKFISKNTANEVLSRLKGFLNIKTDQQLADYLEISKRTIDNWRTRGSLDLTLIIEKCNDISIDYLLTGLLPMTLSERNELSQKFGILNNEVSTDIDNKEAEAAMRSYEERIKELLIENRVIKDMYYEFIRKSSSDIGAHASHAPSKAADPTVCYSTKETERF